MTARNRLPPSGVFSEISNEPALEEWQDIPAETRFELVEYEFGNEIFTSDKPLTRIGILLDGKAEIYSHAVIRFNHRRAIAYRPIRLLNEGDLFGDFDALDCWSHAEDENALGVRADAELGEKWRGVAGCRSLLIEKNLSIHHVQDLCDIAEKATGKANLELALYLSKKKCMRPTQVAYFDANVVSEKNCPLLHKIFRRAWTGARAYRTAVNSFNFERLLQFRVLTMAEYIKLASGKGPKGKKIRFYDHADVPPFLDPFIDALYDALNRPLRREPVFQKIPATHYLLQDGVKEALAEVSIETDCIWVPSMDLTQNFAFPIDHTNYLIALHGTAEFESEEVSTSVANLITRTFWDEKPTHINVAPGEKKSARKLLYELATNAITVFLNQNRSYQYRVSCGEFVGPTGATGLMYHFTPKARCADNS